MYNPVTDFMGLIRQTSNGAEFARMPGMDYVVSALARANMFRLWTGQAAPIVNQETTVWLKPAQPSWTGEGTVYLYNSDSEVFEPATPLAWSEFLTVVGSGGKGTSIVFLTRDDAENSVIPATVTSIVALRYSSGHPLDYATLVRGSSTGPAALQDGGGNWWELDLTPGVHMASWYGVNGDGGEYSAQLQQAVTFAAIGPTPGAEIRLPRGTFAIATPVTPPTPAVNGLPGMRICGATTGATIIDVRTTGGIAALRFYGGVNCFGYNGYVKSIKFMTTTGSPGPAVDIYAQYRFCMEDCEVNQLAGHGTTITAFGAGGSDGDASNTIIFRRNVWFGNAAAGLAHNFANGIVGTSYVRCEDCWFSANALTGWYYVGLSGSMYNCSFNENGYGVGGQAGLWIADNGGSNAQFRADQCGFENNYVGCIRMDRMIGAEFTNTEFAATATAIVSTYGVNATNSVKCRFSGTRVRIGPTFNPYTAFLFSDGTADCAVENTEFTSFDAVGQARFFQSALGYGSRFDDGFDAVQEGAENGVMGFPAVNGANQNVALPLSGTVYVPAGAISAPFNIGGFTNGWPGRQLTIVNATGAAMTLNHEDGGSTPANRIWTGGAPRVVNNTGSVTLVYYSPASRWVVK